MLNGQLKSFATTSPRPLIRDSSDFYSLYSESAGGPIVCGVLEDCSDCNLGSFISAGPEGGPFLSLPLTFMGNGIVAEAGRRHGAAGAVHWGIGSFLARQD